MPPSRVNGTNVHVMQWRYWKVSHNAIECTYITNLENLLTAEEECVFAFSPSLQLSPFSRCSHCYASAFVTTDLCASEKEKDDSDIRIRLAIDPSTAFEPLTAAVTALDGSLTALSQSVFVCHSLTSVHHTYAKKKGEIRNAYIHV